VPTQIFDSKDVVLNDDGHCGRAVEYCSPGDVDTKYSSIRNEVTCVACQCSMSDSLSELELLRSLRLS
jgi:hypothetical protein